MRASWEALKRSLQRSVDLASTKFDDMKRQQTRLRPFADASALLAHLNDAGGDLDGKDAIYANLVSTLQARGGDAEFATALVWLGLWPGLDRIYRRRLREFAAEPEALVSEVSARFMDVVHKADLGKIHRVAATLVLNVDRDVRDALKRRWLEDGLRADMPEDDAADEHARLEPDEDIHALRARLVEVVGDDADLVIGCLVYGESQREMAERLGLSHDAARKRLQRATAKIRQRFPRAP